MVKVKKISSNPRPSKANRSKAVVSDEEILSDEEVSDMDGEGESVFEIEETAEEAKIRLAKQMISNAEQEEEDVESVLKKYALEERGRLFVPVAESLPEVLDPPTFAKGHINSITCIRVAKDGSIYTGSKDCCIIVWDPITLKKTKILKGFRHNRKTGNHFDEILALDITDDSKFLATGGKDRIIRLWNGVTLEPIDMLKGHRDTVTGLAFQRNTHLLYSASADRSVKVWNLDDMAYLNTLFGHQSFIMGIDSFTSERAVTCGDDKTVRVWKSIEEVQQVYAGHEASIDCIAIVSADTFLTGSQDGAVGMWKVHKKKPVFMLNNAHGGGDYWISSLSVLRNTDLAASGSHDGNINLYRVEQESLTLLMKIPVVGYVNCLSFARSGQFLAVGIGQDHRLGRWTSTQRAKNGVTLVPLPISLNINV